MAHFARIHPSDMTPAQLALYREIVEGTRSKGEQHFSLVDASGALQGPFNAFLLSPGIGMLLQRLGVEIRYHSTLSPRVRELSVLMVANHWQSAFELAAHEPLGRAAGVTPEELGRLRERELLPLSDPKEQAALLAVRKMLDNSLEEDDRTTIERWVGPIQLFELSVLVGYYAMLAQQLVLFAVQD